MQYKLRMSPEQVLQQAVSMVKYARNLCPEVQFSLEDYTRTEEEFSWKVIEAVIAAGAAVGGIFGRKYEKKAEIFGGVTLIFLGLKILLENLGVL